MHSKLSETSVKSVLGNAKVTEEYKGKVKELTRRLEMNGLDYTRWDTLTDNHQTVFSEDIFLEPTSAESLEEYVNDAVESCWCPDVIEDLHDHSPALIEAIEEEHENQESEINVVVGEGVQYLNDLIKEMLEERFGPHPLGFESPESDVSEIWQLATSKLPRLNNPKSPDELYDEVSKIALEELETEFGAGWIDNTAEKWKVDGVKIKNDTLEQEGKLKGSRSTMWKLTNTGSRELRNKVLNRIASSLKASAFAAKIDTVRDEEEDRTKAGFLVRLYMLFKFPTADGKVVDVPWTMELIQGMGAGGTAEGQQLTIFQQALLEAIEKNNGQPVAIEFPNGLGTVSGVANVISGPKRKTKGRVGDPKTDFVLQDKAGNNLYFLSAKDGDKPRNFNQWGGFSNVPDESMGEVKSFAISAANFILFDREQAKTDGDPLRHYEWQKKDGENVLKRMVPGSVPAGMAIAKPIKNRMLKLKAVFGEDFGTVNPQTEKANHGLDYVNATFQIPAGSSLTLEEKTEGDPSVLEPKGFVHVFGPAQFSGYPSMTDMSEEQMDNEIDQVMGREYHPILLLRRAESGRSEGVSTKIFGPKYGSKAFLKRKEAEAAADAAAAVDTSLGAVGKLPRVGLKIPISMQSVRFGIFPAENRPITHVMDDDFKVIAVWDKEAAEAAGGCGSWYCNKAALDAAGGAVEIKEDGSRTPLDLTGKVDADIIGGADKSTKKPSAQAFSKFKMAAANIKR